MLKTVQTMKKYDYNSEFFGQWLREHSNISKRDILTVIENKDYASLKRWAEGNIMPTHTILRLCNHYGIDIWNFFIGMTPRVSAEDKAEETSDTAMSDTENKVRPLEQAEEAGANITPADLNVKKAQWEARYQKDLHMKEIEHQRQIDEMRREYEQRLDDQRREFMATINKQIDQIMYLSNLAAREAVGYTPGMASDHHGKSTVPNHHPVAAQIMDPNLK